MSTQKGGDWKSSASKHAQSFEKSNSQKNKFFCHVRQKFPLSSIDNKSKDQDHHIKMLILSLKKERESLEICSLHDDVFLNHYIFWPARDRA